jgi:tetratricopeptide (TPR) repeat protein
MPNPDILIHGGNLMRIHLLPSLAFVFCLVSTGSVAAGIDDDVRQLQHRWAEVNYQLEGKTQITAFEELVADADRLAAAHPDSAETLIWSGIIKSSFAGAKGGLGAMKLAKASRADLEHALEIDPDALQGSAYTSLGTLYFKVPGWPIGFGDEDKAEELLQQALALNPDGIDSNYFWGDFLLEQKRYTEAEQALVKAQHAPSRPERPLADAGRQKEIEVALLKVRKKLR